MGVGTYVGTEGWSHRAQGHGGVSERERDLEMDEIALRNGEASRRDV